MVKSPVEGSTAALVRLETSVSFSDFVRPICLPDISEAVPSDSAPQNVASDAERLSQSSENRDFFIASQEFGSRSTRSISDEAISSSVTKRANETLTRPVPQPEKELATQWTMCNTLGWSRPRDQLQRVQLKIGNMEPCENISIATVNSMCTEAAFHKQDCTEEEFAGSPVMCLMSDSHRWALVGIASWRIACAPTGIERPRMYDKIAPNAAWIRRTINSV